MGTSTMGPKKQIINQKLTSNMMPECQVTIISDKIRKLQSRKEKVTTLSEKHDPEKNTRDIFKRTSKIAQLK